MTISKTIRQWPRSKTRSRETNFQHRSNSIRLASFSFFTVAILLELDYPTHISSTRHVIRSRRRALLQPPSKIARQLSETPVSVYSTIVSLPLEICGFFQLVALCSYDLLCFMYYALCIIYCVTISIPNTSLGTSAASTSASASLAITTNTGKTFGMAPSV